MIRVGLIGLGAMGRVHFDCWRASKAGQLVAIADRDARKLAGDWAGQEFNIGDQAAAQVDLTGIATYLEAEKLIADPAVELVDICMPTPFHAPLTIAALRAGKHVFCEKPMALNVEECRAMEATAREAGRQLTIGHCLRYWPHYVKAKEMLDSGEFGRAVYASFERTGAAPMWSSGGWLMRAKESGGVLDMHIHDVDIALWWFGRPRSFDVSGHAPEGLPMIIDALWRYDGGLSAHLHSVWDRNGGAFRHAFRLVMEKATLVYDLARDPASLFLLREGKETILPVETPMAYHAELDDFAQACASGRPSTRVTPAASREALEIGLAEIARLTA